MLAAVQRVLLIALQSDDPAGELERRLADASDLTAQERERLRAIDGDGLRVTALLVRKLRFERLTSGAPELLELFEQRPEAFVSLFAAYTSAVPPRAYFPDQEGDLFRRWQKNT